MATALFNKAVSFGQMGKSEEALAVYDEVVERFGEARPSASGTVAMALFNKA